MINLVFPKEYPIFIKYIIKDFISYAGSFCEDMKICNGSVPFLLFGVEEFTDTPFKKLIHYAQISDILEEIEGKFGFKKGLSKWYMDNKLDYVALNVEEYPDILDSAIASVQEGSYEWFLMQVKKLEFHTGANLKQYVASDYEVEYAKLLEPFIELITNKANDIKVILNAANKLETLGNNIPEEAFVLAVHSYALLPTTYDKAIKIGEAALNIYDSYELYWELSKCYSEVSERSKSKAYSARILNMLVNNICLPDIEVNYAGRAMSMIRQVYSTGGIPRHELVEFEQLLETIRANRFDEKESLHGYR